MNRHTPGPWRECGADRGGCQCNMVWSEADDIVVAVAVDAFNVNYTAGCGCDEETAKGNARLIAAAPDLLAALEMASMFVNRDDMVFSQGDHGDRIYVLDVISAAIARARGES